MAEDAREPKQLTTLSEAVDMVREGLDLLDDNVSMTETLARREVLFVTATGDRFIASIRRD
jgi:hypothetical protein